jgi:hypothetical protein
MKTMRSRAGWLWVAGLVAGGAAWAGSESTPLLKFTAGETLAQGDFRRIGGVYVDAKDRVFVAGDKQVAVYGAQGGKALQKWTVPLAQVEAVAVDKEGFIFVSGFADGRKPQIVKLANDDSGKVLAQWGESGSEPGQIAGMCGLGVTDDYVLLADPSNRCIHRYNKDGKAVDDLGKRAANKMSGFSTCCGILDFGTDAQGNTYVGNLGAHRVEVLNAKGQPLAHWGQSGDGPQDFCGCCNPVSVAVAPNGVVFTAEKTIPRIKAFSAKDHQLLAVFGEGEFGAGCARLDIAVDSKLNVYGVDENNGLIRVYHPPQKLN